MLFSYSVYQKMNCTLLDMRMQKYTAETFTSCALDFAVGTCNRLTHCITVFSLYHGSSNHSTNSRMNTLK
jgi:hypothetical protein